MRPLAKTATGVLATAALILSPVLAGSSSAAAPAKAGASSSHGKPAAKPAKPAAKPTKAPSKAKSKVVLVGVVSATQTVTTSGTSTVLVTLKVQGGSDKEYRQGAPAQVTVTKDTVVKRNNGRKSRYEIKVGDKVTVHARRDAAGKLTAFYVAASGRNQPKPVEPAPSSTNTATTTATTKS